MTISQPPQGHLRVHGSLPNQSACEKALERVTWSILWGVPRKYGIRCPLLREFGVWTTRAGAWFVLPAVSQTCFWHMLDFARAAICHQFCS
ncbi:hypothetical protein D4764_01G0000070 [Takifugu flavidus]|uniref:Uncharacterized protein n=1 Tax=Takifugu flavidus TaxID=433684 RepID=A0A5C6PJZ8_9TELE|nr:hypothetical protein D4764_01G0000070 [Takifugu flavidus]